MKLDITKGIQRKGVDVPFSLSGVWGEDHWNGDTIAYVQPVSFSGTYMLADGEAEPDEDQYTYTGHVLELDDAVRTAILLELPSRILCKEDCRGLCAQCGANLNVNVCSCQKDLTSRNPFSALASLLNEDEEV